MAYGTESVPPVDKIVGPGNVFVTEAKRQVFGDVGIDLLAGSSEVLVVADKTADPELVEAELLSQLEHGKDSAAILVSDSDELTNKIKERLGDSVKTFQTANIDESIMKGNEYAPEHIVLMANNEKNLAERFRNYGSMFIGNQSAVAFGDYVSGTNHILPTSGTARFMEGLSVRTYIKQQSYQYITKEGVKQLSDAAMELSEKEGLLAHQASVKKRIGEPESVIDKD